MKNKDRAKKERDAYIKARNILRFQAYVDYSKAWDAFTKTLDAYTKALQRLVN